MKLYTRKDFLTLPKNTIYSRVENRGELCTGLYCKTNTPEELGVDWVEQDLISECGFPNNIIDGCSAFDYQINLRDTFQEFRTDLYCSGRDGMFEESDVFVVWDKEDVTKLRDYLNDIIND